MSLLAASAYCALLPLTFYFSAAFYRYNEPVDADPSLYVLGADEEAVNSRTLLGAWHGAWHGIMTMRWFTFSTLPFLLQVCSMAPVSVLQKCASTFAPAPGLRRQRGRYLWPVPTHVEPSSRVSCMDTEPYLGSALVSSAPCCALITPVPIL